MDIRSASFRWKETLTGRTDNDQNRYRQLAALARRRHRALRPSTYQQPD